MAEVKWIKLTTDMFDNRKIKYLRTLPEGNNIVLIWVMLLTMAGRCNAGGMIFLTENIPYTVKILADELGFDSNVVEVALQALSSMGMLTCDENDFRVTNWEEYQNIEGMEKIREQTRQRVAKYREKQKRIGNVTVTDGNATDIDKDKEIERDKNNSNKFSPPSIEEVKAYCEERKNGVDPQRWYDFYLSKNFMVGKNKMRDWKASVRTWERDNKPVAGQEDDLFWKAVNRIQEES